MSKKWNLSVGQRLKAGRKSAGMTQEELAERIDRTKEAVSKIERGNNLPTIETLERLCGILEISLADLFKETPGSISRINAISEIDVMLSKMNDDDVTMIRDIIQAIRQRKA